jgi:cysteine-rich repeat protein
MMRARAVATVALLLLASHAWAIDIQVADDVCAPTDDPCLVSQDFNIVDGSVLDFGTRTLQVTVNGVLDTNAGQATILCGSFLTDTGTVPALKVRGGNGLGGIDGGILTLEARRRCSLDNDRTCVADTQCNFGTCSVKVCAGDHAVTCLTDESCNFGTCDLTDGKCTNSARRACTEDTDCMLGTCSIDACAENKTQQCSTDDDCNFGTCSVGDATVTTNRPILGNGSSPASVFIRAAGDITIGDSVSVNSTNSDNDGGIIDFESGSGTIAINDLLSATGGGFATGGEICLIAGQDVVVNSAVDASGGDFDGGFVEFDAGNDIVLTQSVRANANNGGGFGGEISLTAAHDVIASSPATVEANGHFAAVDQFGGDGGSIEISSDSNALTVNTGVVMDANGAEPDGFGGEILLESGTEMTIAGTLAAKTADDAAQGAGGNIDLDVGAGLMFPATGLLDARGASNGGGAISIVTVGPMTYAGTIDARTSNAGSADSISLDISGDVVMTGSMRISGTAESQINGQVDFEFCRLQMQSGALIQNVGGFGKNLLRAREKVTINAGAQLTADTASGLNRITYRDPAKPPVVNGTVSPAAAPNDINAFLQGCPVCGNGELDGGESCEDGNTQDGDGCSHDCQDEACVAQTSGYPNVPLCDDGDGCTVDTCESSTCQHVASCDDGIDCTADSCDAQNECVHTIDDGACNDDNPCTNDICSLGARGCVNVNNTDTCDDGIACTINDRCNAGVCSGGANCPEGQTCNPNSGQCQEGGVCGDGLVDGLEECDDGDTLWSPGESCGADCLLVACGDPDDSGTIRSSDALFILRTAVGTAQCDDCVCNVDESTGTTTITASDSLRVLRKAVGIDVQLSCPVCL